LGKKKEEVQVNTEKKPKYPSVFEIDDRPKTPKPEPIIKEDQKYLTPVMLKS